MKINKTQVIKKNKDKYVNTLLDVWRRRPLRKPERDKRDFFFGWGCLFFSF